MSPCHSFSTGQHEIQRTVAVTPRTMLTEMMMNHTNHLVRPVVMRRRLSANDVLLHAAPRMAQKPAP